VWWIEDDLRIELGDEVEVINECVDWVDKGDRREDVVVDF
jgi:hypothetical protein